MIRKLIPSVLLFLAISSQLVFGQLWSGVLAPSRATDWTQAGVVGGIPSGSWSRCTTGTGTGVLASSSTAAQINTAISGCDANHYVELGAGTFSLSTGLLWNSKSNVLLRGQGANQTLLVFSAADSCKGWFGVICFTSSDLNYSGGPSILANWTAGYSAGATSITLSSVSNLVVGNPITLDQTDDVCGAITAGHCAGDNNAVFICYTPLGQCSTNGDSGGAPRAGRSQQQIVTVIGIAGNVVTISPGLQMPNWSAGKSPQAWWATNPIFSDGIENLSINVGSSGALVGVAIFNCKDCWVKGIRTVGPFQRSAVQMIQDSHITVQDNYFFHSDDDAANNYGVEPFPASDILVQNNIFEQIQAPYPANGSCTGCVFAYNFDVNNVFLNATPPTFLAQSAYAHAVGDDHILYEGNIGAGFNSDNFHGTHHLQALFRNYWNGYQKNEGFFNQDGQGTRPVILGAYSRFYNVIGNVLGNCALQSVYENAVGNVHGGSAIFDIGFGNAIPNDANTVTTLFRWGNYDCITNTNRFVNGEVPSGLIGNQAAFANPVPANQTLPASFYLSVQPAWWPAGKPWPPIGPDVTGGNVKYCVGGAQTGTYVLTSGQCPGGTATTLAGGRIASTPAMDCYLNTMSGPPNGVGGPLAFTCNYAIVGNTSNLTTLSGAASVSGIAVIGGVGTQLVLTSVTVSPSNPIIPFTAAQSFSASGLYSDGSTADLSSVATWGTSNSVVANNVGACINPGCATFQCSTRGVATVTATYQSVSGNTTLNCQSPTFTPQGTLNATQSGSPVTIVQFLAANGTAPFTFSSPDLPGFLSLSSSGCAGTQINCSLVGTPATVGVFSFHVQVADGLGNLACTAPGCVVSVNVVASNAEDNTYCDGTETVIGQPNDPPAAPIINCNNTAIANTTLGGSPTTIFVCPVGELSSGVAVAGCAGAPQPVGALVPACWQPGGAATPYYCSMVQSAVNLVANTTGCGSDIRIYPTLDDANPNSAWNKYTEPTIVAPVDINCGPDFTQPWWYIRTKQFANIPPPGNRVSPAFAGITSINGRPSYSQTSAFSIPAGRYMPMLRAEVTPSGATFLSSQATATLSGLRMMGVVVAAAHARDASVDLYGKNVCPLNSAGTPQCTPGGSGGLVFLGCNIIGGANCGTTGGQHNILDRVILSGCDDLTMATCYDAMQVHTIFAGGRHLSIIDSYTLHAFCIYLNGPCVDSKSIGGGAGPGTGDDYSMKIVNNYLEATGECFIIGGGAMPSGVFATDWELRRNHCWKPLTWKADRPEFGTGGIKDSYAAFSNNGTGYTGATTCSVDPPVFGGVTATCHPIVIAGSIADVIMDTPGSGYGLQKKGNGTYVKYPNFYFTDGGVTYTSCGTQLSGDANTNGTAVTWFDGDKFKSGLAGTNITINGVNYLVDTVTNSTNIVIHTSAGVQTNVPYSSNFNVRGDCIQAVVGVPNVKNPGELKNMKRMLWEGNIFENNWAGQSDQTGFGMLISPKNANNGCPTCTVEDVTIRYNFTRNVAMGWQIALAVASQGLTLAQYMRRISLHDNYVDGMNGPLWTTGTAMIPTSSGMAVQFENANSQAGATSAIKMYHNLFLSTLGTGFTSTAGALMNISSSCNFSTNGTTPALMTYVTMEDTIGAGGVRQTSSLAQGCGNCVNNACLSPTSSPTENALRSILQSDFELPVSGPNYADNIVFGVNINNGVVNTNGTNVDWVSGKQFISAMAGNLITINKVNYTVASFNSVTNLTLAASAGVQNSKIYNTGAYTCTVVPTTCTLVGGLDAGGVAGTCSVVTGTGLVSRTFVKTNGKKYLTAPAVVFDGTCTQVPLATAWIAGGGNPKDSAYCFTHNAMPTAAWNGELGMSPYPQTNGDPVNGVCDGVGHNNTNLAGTPIPVLTWADLQFVNYNTDTGTGAECSTVSTACTNGQPPGTGDLHLKASSPFHNGATDGRDIGPDADKVIGKSDGSLPSPYTGITIDPVNKVLVLPQ